MATVLDLISDALLDLNVLAAGDAPSAADAAGALRALNRLVDQWAAEKLEIYSWVRTVTSITANVSTYTVGSGGTVNIVRPVYIDKINLVDTNQSPSIEIPLTKLTEQAYQDIPVKSLTSTYPTAWYWDAAYSATARGTLTFWPVPTGSGLQFAMYVPTAVPEFSALNTVIALPPGYRRMIVKSLAVDLAPSYGRQAQDLERQAMAATAVVKRTNRRPAELRFEPAAMVEGNRGRYDIVSDRFL